MRIALLAAALVATQLATRAAAEGRGQYDSLALRPKDQLLVDKCAEIEDLLVRRGAVVTQGPEVDLVRRVGEAVKPATPVDPYMRFRFGVIRDPIPNAFALPDGQVYVHQGLLALLENEAQLAGVLAHECMHVEGHHSILNARQARKKAGGALVLSILLGDIGSLIDIAILHAMIGYGRDLEEEADKRAIDRVLGSGYDPREMARSFELLDVDPEGERIDPRPSWSDHPMNVARAQYTREIVAGLAPRIAEEEARRGGLRVGEDDFTAQSRAASYESIEMWLEADRPRLALLWAKRMAVRWPEDADAHYLLGDGYRALDARLPELPPEQVTKKAKRHRLREYEKKTREEREALRRANPTLDPVLKENQARSEEAYREALRLEADHAGALRGLGYLLEEANRLVEAGYYLREYLRVAPGSSDRAVVVRHLSEITEALRTTPPAEESQG